ncbi:solute carrier family 46 member 3 [Huso huso]|uniref:Solute carrier family 46 member 3 n=1 Tax=Huso huso TaxID=61971 RepID=A0ABR0ZVI8_HUSHU
MCERLDKIRKIITVEPVMFLYMTGTFLLTPAYQQLLIAKVCNELYHGENICGHLENYTKENQAIQSKTSYILLVYVAVLSLVSIPPAIIFGSWSDKAGRKLGMILPSVCSAVGGGFLIVVTEVEQINAYWTIFTAFVIGISGGHVAVFLSVFSYLADVTNDENRTLRMAILESMVFIGGTVGFLLSGTLIQYFSFTPVFGIFCLCHVLSVLYVLLLLRNPDSGLGKILNGVASHRSDDEPKLSIFMYAKLSFKSVLKKRAGKDRLKLQLLILCTFLMNICNAGEQTVVLLFLMYPPRNFTGVLYSAFTSTKMLLSGLCLVGLFPLLLRFVGEMTLAKVSAVMRAASFILLAFSTNTWMVFLVAVVGATSGFTQAVVRSVSSRIVEPNEQGAMFSFSASVETACILIGAGIFNSLYPVTLTTFPGMAFLVMAAFIIITLILIQWISEMPTTHPQLLIIED